MRPCGFLLAVGVSLAASSAPAVNLGIGVQVKLVVVDKLMSSGTAKVVFKGRGALKGQGTDPEQISARFDVAYDDEAAIGTFVVPAGTANGWRSNDERIARYVNRDAPLGPTEVKSIVLKEGRLVKFVARGVGAPALDIVGGGDPAGPVFASLCADNAGEELCNCAVFDACSWRPVGAGTGAKLTCRNGLRDFACQARCTDTREPGRFVDQGLTVLDTCNMLEWEKKQTEVNSGVDPGNLQDVDNTYAWAGLCSVSGASCQPTAGAAAACAAETSGALGCDECGAGEGTCDVVGITTVWEWVDQLNAANFAGHADWRLPTSQGPLGLQTGDAPELESIIDFPPVGDFCSGGACIDPIFGPTRPRPNVPPGRTYWSASTISSQPGYASSVDFNGGVPTTWEPKDAPRSIRAVRSVP